MEPSIPWSVKNQARMHFRNNTSPYTSSVEAISKFPETATSIGVKLNEQDKLILTAPCGITDLINMHIKPTAFFENNREQMKVYEQRLKSRDWGSRWEHVEIFKETRGI